MAYGDDQYGGWCLEYATLTGEVQDGQIGVSAFGTSFFVRPLYGTAFQSVPTKQWLDKYAKQFFALIGYEKDRKQQPILMGLVPTGKYVLEPDKHKIQTEKYRIVIDDVNDNFFIEGKNINLGSENAAEAVPLGNTLEQTLKDLIGILREAKVMTAIGPQLFMPPTQERLQQWADDLDKILSTKTKTD